MLEITLDNCYKCDLETINDPNNSQCPWKKTLIEKKKNLLSIHNIFHCYVLTTLSVY